MEICMYYHSYLRFYQLMGIIHDQKLSHYRTERKKEDEENKENKES